jgi:hypothetical protein
MSVHRLVWLATGLLIIIAVATMVTGGTFNGTGIALILAAALVVSMLVR